MHSFLHPINHFFAVHRYLGATSLFDLLMGGGGPSRHHHRHHGLPKGAPKVIPLKYIERMNRIHFIE